jgi:hypothetical protein
MNDDIIVILGNSNRFRMRGGIYWGTEIVLECEVVYTRKKVEELSKQYSNVPMNQFSLVKSCQFF